MDGIEKITGRIAADASQEIAAIQAEARRQADEIAGRYEAQARRESEDILARGRRAAIRRLPPAAIGCHFPAGAPQLEHVLPQPPHRPPFPPGPPPPHAAMELP